MNRFVIMGGVIIWVVFVWVIWIVMIMFYRMGCRNSVSIVVFVFFVLLCWVNVCVLNVSYCVVMNVLGMISVNMFRWCVMFGYWCGIVIEGVLCVGCFGLVGEC